MTSLVDLTMFFLLDLPSFYKKKKSAIFQIYLKFH